MLDDSVLCCESTSRSREVIGERPFPVPGSLLGSSLQLSCLEKGIDLTMSKDLNLVACECPLHPFTKYPTLSSSFLPLSL